MKIRTKITAIFIGLTALLQIVIFAFIYYFGIQYKEDEFYLRLKQRASIAAHAYLDEYKVNPEVYADIRTKHLQTLPNEHEGIYEVNVKEKKLLSQPKINLPSHFINAIFSEQYAELHLNNTYYTGILYKDNAGDFIVVLSAEDSYGEAKLKNLRNNLILAFLLSLVSVAVIGQFAAKLVLHPITQIINKVNSIRVTNLNSRLEAGNNKDEIRELADTFNSMLDRLETSFDIQSKFIHNASHELRNPLAAIMGQTEIAQNKDRSTEEYKAILKTIEMEASRLNSLVTSLLKLAQTDYDNKGLLIESIRIDELLLEIKENIDYAHPENKVQIDFSDLPSNPDLLVIQGSQSLLTVAINNVVENAVKFSINREVILKLITDDDWVRIVVTDRGIGIPPEDLQNIFEPFYRGANARDMEGFGFGLPLAHKILKLHSGDIRISSEVDKGTIVKMLLPHRG